MVAATRTVRTGPPPKGDRKGIMVRLPQLHAQHFAALAEELGISQGDYVGYRAAICEGLDIPAEVLWHAPRVVLLYDDEADRRRVLERMPPHVLGKIRDCVPEVQHLIAPTATTEPAEIASARARAKQLRRDGVTWRALTEQLNAEGFRTLRGGPWYLDAVIRLVKMPEPAAEPLPLTG